VCSSDLSVRLAPEHFLFSFVTGAK